MDTWTAKALADKKRRLAEIQSRKIEGLRERARQLQEDYEFEPLDNLFNTVVIQESKLNDIEEILDTIGHCDYDEIYKYINDLRDVIDENITLD